MADLPKRGFEVRSLPLEELSDMDAGSGPSPLKHDDMSDLRERQSQPLGMPHEGQEFHYVRRVKAVAGMRTARRGENPPSLVQPKRLAGEPAARRDLPDEQTVSFHRASIGLAPWGRVKR